MSFGVNRKIDYNVIFLHLPKTAGQTIHAGLEDAYGVSAMFPWRDDIGVLRQALSTISRYRVFSGHISWRLLDCVRGPSFIFTILRDPPKRIMSMYLYLKRKSKNENIVGDILIDAVDKYSVDDFFNNMNLPERRVIDQTFDNLYTFYFGYRSFDGYSIYNSLNNEFNIEIGAVVDMALSNMAYIDHIGVINNMEETERVLRLLLGVEFKISNIRLNDGGYKGLGHGTILKEMGATNKTWDAVERMTWCDMKIYKEVLSLYK